MWSDRPLRPVLTRAVEANAVINDKTVAVVLPAYNAARTLQATVDELPAI